MIIFANYKLLWLLLAVPLFPLFCALARYLRGRRMRRFGDPQTVAALMPSVSSAAPWVRMVFYTLAYICLVIGLARPQMGARIKEQTTKGVEIIVALDVSNSMLAEDYSPNRLDRAKLAISKIVDKLHDDRIGLVLFAGDAFVQLPVTTDYVSAKMFLNSISTSSVAVQGTAMGEAIALSIKAFSAQSENSRAIIVITDGENHEDDPVAMARQAAEMGIKVFTIGVGSPEGKPIPMDGELLKDRDGNIVVTRLDEQTLKDVAAAGGGAYVKAGNSEFGLDPIVSSIRKMDAEEFNSQVFEEYDEQFMYFFAAALLFLIVAMLTGDRRHRRNIFS